MTSTGPGQKLSADNRASRSLAAAVGNNKIIIIIIIQKSFEKHRIVKHQ